MEHPSQSTDEILDQDHTQEFLVPNDEHVRRAWHMATISHAYAQDVGLSAHDKNSVPATAGPDAHIFNDGEFADPAHRETLERWMNCMAGMAAQRASLKVLENELTRLRTSIRALFDTLTSYLEPWYEALIVQNQLYLQEHKRGSDAFTLYDVFKEQSEKRLVDREYLQAVRLVARCVEHLYVELAEGLVQVLDGDGEGGDGMEFIG